MPRRRRSSKRRGGPAGDGGALFVHGDGLSPFFTGDPVYPNRMLARAAWCECRVLSWRHEFRGMWPPHGALHWDAINARTRHANPISMGRNWSVQAVRDAVAGDVASVERFRQDDPAGAREVADELDMYIEDLGMFLSIAETCGEDATNEMGYHHKAGDAWMEYEVRRRDELIGR